MWEEPQWRGKPLSEARAELTAKHPRAEEGASRLVGVLLGVALVVTGAGLVSNHALGPARSGLLSLVALALLVLSVVLNRAQNRALARRQGQPSTSP
jgi:peptidoglycan/LPS O-acetylase OafA/YrhL